MTHILAAIGAVILGAVMGAWIVALACSALFAVGLPVIFAAYVIQTGFIWWRNIQKEKLNDR